MLNEVAVFELQVRVAFAWKVNVTSSPRPFRSVLLPLVGSPFSPGLNASARSAVSPPRTANATSTAATAMATV
jgi:hypothetical protein